MGAREMRTQLRQTPIVIDLPDLHSTGDCKCVRFSRSGTFYKGYEKCHICGMLTREKRNG